MREIHLTRGKVALVDDEDFALVSQYGWSYRPSRNTGYAIRNTDGMRMHRLILSTPATLIVDHTNGIGTDNRRSNIRNCNRQENDQNRSTIPNRTSRFKGVSWRSSENKFRAQIFVNKRQVSLGLFRNEQDAAVLYDFVARQFFGPFARLNFPEVVS